MVTRRNVLRGLIAGGATLGLGGLAAGQIHASSDPRAGEEPNYWHDQMSATRVANRDELDAMTTIVREAAVEVGYPRDWVGGAIGATISTTPRGTSLGKASLVLDDNSVLIASREFGLGGFARQSVRTLWTDGATIARDLDPRKHAESVGRGSPMDGEALAALSLCCTPTGAALGKCCSYDLKGMFECCAPCGFSLPSGIGFLACVAIWCNYCNTAYCKKWYRVCR